ncbi:hypothetical protein J5N97_010078 [Dioscorea zingiberensis]|uniref:C2H2-type domain-containing protein n=1 Tax=Dioscorea zingiberensis TaxID=325984 RepID=A0A9D5CYQ6_9LILI|nr:hypothetical protein J5N97_010078 [Dioscorea zingiberensis]
MDSRGKEKVGKPNYSAPPPRMFLKIKIKGLQKNLSSSQKPDEKDSEQGENYETTLHVCTVCGKVFHAEKKLYNHMRVYLKKGIVPPEEKNTIHSTSEEEPVIKELLASHSSQDKMMDYRGWMNFDPDSMGPCENQAALILQMLSEDVTDNSISKAKARALVTEMHDFYLESNKKRKIENDDDDVQEQAQEDKTKAYACHTCNKLFSTPQALGGHRANHTKVKNNSNVVETSEKGKMISGQAKKHQCNKCDAVFPCGQALGGHMRKHFLKDHPRAMVVEQSHQVFDFDLNEEPIMEGGEGAGERGVEEE